MDKNLLLKNLIIEDNQDDIESDLKEKLKDRYWRLNNLYFIKDKTGKKIRFKFNKFQENLYKNLWYFTIILKARQLGVTTFFCILYLDAVLFESNKTACIIAHTENDAKKIFKNKIKFAFDNLPSELRGMLEIKTDSKEELSFRNGSSISVSVSTRSGTIQYLHISEFGYTCQKFPEKAEEIVTGSINSVEQGQVVSIESTAKGREGYFFRFCEQAQLLQKSGKKLNKLEFSFFFFPWWENEEYILNNNEIIPITLIDYFDNLESIMGVKISEFQRQWYWAKYKTLEEQMFSEYPSTPEEAFKASIEGAYYQKQISKVYEQKRIGFIPFDSKIMVDTYWDLGRDDLNVILFVQNVGKEIRFIDLYYNRGEGLSHYVNELKKRRDDFGYIYRNHYLPWDVEIKELTTNTSRKQTLIDLGMNGIKVVQKLSSQEGIEMVRGLFNRFWFDESKCKRLIDALINYRADWDDKLGVYKSEARHDEHSHFADAVRYLAVSFNENLNQEIIQEKENFNKYSIFDNV